jgi:outer membrane lipoprotein carrier protein
LGRRPYFTIPFYILLLVYILPVNAYPDVDSSKIIKGLREKYGNAEGWSAEYTREAISKTMAMLGEADRHDVAAGSLYFESPHFLRLEQDSPQKELLVTDGHTVWWYIPVKKEVYKYPAAKFGRELSLLSDILKGMEYSEKELQIAVKETPQTGNHHIILKRNPPWQDIDHLEMVLSEENFAIERLDIYNSIGGLTRFILSDWKKVRSNPESFNFPPPPGVKVIEN